jgi:hypothetical protein
LFIRDNQRPVKVISQSLLYYLKFITPAGQPRGLARRLFHRENPVKKRINDMNQRDAPLTRNRLTIN